MVTKTICISIDEKILEQLEEHMERFPGTKLSPLISALAKQGVERFEKEGGSQE